MRTEGPYTPWEHVAGLVLTWVFALGIIATPQHELRALPHVPLIPLMLAIVFGFLMLLVYRGVVAGVSLVSDLYIGFVYTALVWGPFIYTWVVLSLYSYPTWPSVIAALLGPILLFVASYTQRGALEDPRGPLFDAIPQLGPYFTVITVLAALFVGYGTALLAVFLAAVITSQGFGAVFESHVGLVLIFGAAVTGGVLGMMRRTQRRS